MVRGFLRGAGGVQGSWLVSGVVTCTCLVVAMAVSGGRSRAYTAYSLAVHKTEAIPAFARKYGLRCSACHTAWPELNAFGQRFKDNGSQLGNDRDSPMWQAPAYWPIAMRTTPQWHLESTTHQVTDAAPAGKTVSQTGFDLSGVDFLLLGTLHKNITFGLVPTLDADGTTGLEAAFVRVDNLGQSPWANLKVGEVQLDNLLSEKRVTLFGYLGHRPTAFETVNGGVDTIPGTGSANKSFYRIGATAQIWLGNLELLPLVSHAQDDAALGPGPDKPTWNNALLEAHYVATPRFMVQGRYEVTRMSTQGDPATPKTLGDADAIALGFRYYTVMISRDGMALHGEFAMTRTTGMAPLSGDGSGVDPADPATKVWSRSLLLAFDFAF